MEIKCRVDKPKLEDCEKVLEWKDQVPILFKAHKITYEQPAGVKKRDIHLQPLLCLLYNQLKLRTSES